MESPSVAQFKKPERNMESPSVALTRKRERRKKSVIPFLKKPRKPAGMPEEQFEGRVTFETLTAFRMLQLITRTKPDFWSGIVFPSDRVTQNLILINPCLQRRQTISSLFKF